jgi:hypothetical protein
MKLPCVGSSVTTYRISGSTLQHSRCSTCLLTSSRASGKQRQCCSAYQRTVLIPKTRMSLTARSTRSVICSDSTRQTQVGTNCCSDFLAVVPVHSGIDLLKCRTTSSTLGQLRWRQQRSSLTYCRRLNIAATARNNIDSINEEFFMVSSTYLDMVCHVPVACHTCKWEQYS